MAGKRAEPRADERSQAGAPEQHGERAGEVERAGPLLLERLRKADGRALILYSLAPERR